MPWGAAGTGGGCRFQSCLSIPGGALVCCSLFVVCSGSARCLVDRRSGDGLRDRALFALDHESARPRLSRCTPIPACVFLAPVDLLLPRGVGLAVWPAASDIVLSHCISSSVSPGNSALIMGSQLALSYLLMKAVKTVMMSFAVEPEMSPGPSHESAPFAARPRTAGRETPLVIDTTSKCAVNSDSPSSLSMVAVSEFLSGISIKA